jgi:hypothetical protein
MLGWCDTSSDLSERLAHGQRVDIPPHGQAAEKKVNND